MYLDMGYDISIISDKPNKEDIVPGCVIPEERVFNTYNDAPSIMVHFEENKEDLDEKENAETLTEDESAFMSLVRYINHFSPDVWSTIITFQYWADYKYMLNKDKRLQMVLRGTEEHAREVLYRNNRYYVASGEGEVVPERTGILHTSVIAEVHRPDFHALAKHLFRLFELLDFKKTNFVTDSTTVKAHADEIITCLQTCKTLLGVDASGKDLTANPDYKQLSKFLSDMLTTLIDGTFATTSTKQVTIPSIKVETSHSCTKSGKTTRSKRECVMQYELQFKPPSKPTGVAYTAIERIEHLKPITNEAEGLPDDE